MDIHFPKEEFDRNVRIVASFYEPHLATINKIKNKYEVEKNIYEAPNKLIFSQSLLCLSGLFFLLFQESSLICVNGNILGVCIDVLLCKLSIICFGFAYVSSTACLVLVFLLSRFFLEVSSEKAREKLDFLLELSDENLSESSKLKMITNYREFKELCSDLVPRLDVVIRVGEIYKYIETFPLVFFCFGAILGVSMLINIILFL